MTTEDFGTCLDVIKGIQDTVVFYMKMGNLDNGTGEMKRWGGGGGERHNQKRFKGGASP